MLFAELKSDFIFVMIPWLVLGVAHDNQAGRCWSSWNDYRSAVESADDVDHPLLANITQITGMVETLTSFTLWEDTETIPVSTLCDGVPRAIRRRQSTFFDIYITSYSGVHDSTIPVAIPEIRTAIEPNCSVDDAATDCTRLWSTWNSASSVYLHSVDYDNMRTNDRRRPPCEEPMRVCLQNSCRLNPGDKHKQNFYYWPVTTGSGIRCKGNVTTVTSSATVDTEECGEPSTVEYGDLTFTSPSVYVVIETATAEWPYIAHPKHQQAYSFPQYCGAVQTSLTLTLDPTDLVTIQQGNLEHDTQRLLVNWADFNSLQVPLSAHNFQCSSRTIAKYWSRREHSTKIYDDYSPYFDVPQESISEAKEWGVWGCGNVWGMQPKVVRIEEDMTTSLDGEERWKKGKGERTAMPMGSPTVGLARVPARPSMG